jgi:hypothetical protein
MAKPVKTVGLSYAALRKERIEAVRQWPGCETVAGIQIIRENTPGGFSVRVTLYGKARRGVLSTRLALVIGISPFMARVRAGAEVRCFPSARFCGTPFL